MSNHTGEQPNDGKRPVEIEDLYRIRLVADPQVSPDGRTVAYVQTRLRKKKNDYAANVWLVPADGSGEPRKLTYGRKRDFSPRWSPDGTELAFLSTRSGKPQIWAIPVAGGEARQITRIKRGVGEFAWLPGGEWIAFTSDVDNELDRRIAAEGRKEKGGDGTASNSENREPGGSTEEGFVAKQPPATGATSDEEDEEDEDEKEPEDKGDHARVFTRLHIKSDGQGLDERRSHLFLVSAKGGKPKQITEGDWDVQFVRPSPDGKQLAFISNQEPDEDYYNIQDVFVLPIDDGQPGAMHRVTHHNCALGGLEWLPSGDGFVVFAHRRINEAALATNMEVWTLTLTGETRNFTAGLDRGVSNYVNSDLRSSTGQLRARFSPDGSTIYFLVVNGGAAQIFSVTLDGGRPRGVVTGERQVLYFDVAGNGLVFAATTATHPNDLYRADLDGSNEQQLTDVNRDILDELALSEPRTIWTELPDSAGSENWEERGEVKGIEGWVLLPHGYKEGEKYPMVLEIHGGPHTAYGGAYMHEFQVLAARGYVVLYINPRGSIGYGQEFTDAILTDWGGVDYDDLMAFVDHVIEKGYVDEERMGVAGGSYGGYMAAWIIGQTDRFKAAVASRLVSNLYSAWGNGDFTWMLWNWEFQGTPQERTQLYLERSPITHVEKMHTPLLLTHAQDDLRTNIEQADQMYTALKVLKRNVKMVRFPSGGHDVSRTGKPSLRVERLRYIADWFDEHLK